MSEHVVSFVIEKLGQLLKEEPSSLNHIHKQVENLQTELKQIQCYLSDADSKQEVDERVQILVERIRNVAYDAEDVIDTFIFNVDPTNTSGDVFPIVFKKCVSAPKNEIEIERVEMEIDAIQARIFDIRSKVRHFGLQNLSKGEWLNRSYSQVVAEEEEDIIGLKEDTTKLVAELIKEEKQSQVVAIVGMGGLGKTTLAKKLFNHPDIKRRFSCRCWGFISQETSVGDIMRQILRNVSSISIDEMREVELVENLYNYLKEERYLVVLDDIWSRETWDLLKPALPNGKMGSKILLTTRVKEIGLFMDSLSFLHEHRCLTKEESWNLLCKKAFPKNVAADVGTSSSSSTLPLTHVSEDFKKLGIEMVQKCGNLPLAVTVLGGLLRTTKKSLDEWNNILENLTLYSTKYGVLGMLTLSYNNLPMKLKPCFLYMGIYPENYKIPRKKLIRLWIAEGFITPAEEDIAEGFITPAEEVVANQYLAALIDRSMVQVDEVDFTGTVKTCSLHDLMRDLCIFKAREENFFDISQLSRTETSSTFTVSSTKVRRLAAYLSSGRGSVRFVSLEPCLRSLLLFHLVSSYNLHLEGFTSMLKDLKLLRVLDLQSVPIKGDLHRKIGNLIHLRYLGLRDTGMRLLSPSIGNLRNLQTLDLDRNPGLILPDVISKMGHLRHLYLPKINFSGLHLQMDTLKNLQSLSFKDMGGDAVLVSNLTSLRKLRFETDSETRMEALLQNPKFECLQSLNLAFSTPSSHKFGSNLVTALSCCKSLLKLKLNGCLEESCLKFPPSLTKLTLQFYGLEQDPMPELGKLPRLKFLRFDDHQHVRKMVCSAKSFPQLQVLHFRSCALEEWIIEKEAMPSLKWLQIYKCKNLGMVPEGLQYITTLGELEITEMESVFRNRLQGGADFYKVQHIHSIIFKNPLVAVH